MDRNRLQSTRGYLCGAMDRVADGGEQWRVRLQRELSGLGVYWLDPTHKPIDIGIEDAEMRERVNNLKREGRFEEAQKVLKIIRAVDLRMVDISDFLVVNIDTNVHACGTYEEVSLANSQKKPVIVHVEQGKSRTPSWLLAMLPHEMIFTTWGGVHAYLRHVAYDREIQHHKRWWFFDFDLCRKFEENGDVAC